MNMFICLKSIFSYKSALFLFFCYSVSTSEKNDALALRGENDSINVRIFVRMCVEEIRIVFALSYHSFLTKFSIYCWKNVRGEIQRRANRGRGRAKGEKVF